jgi:hypothetical protein
MVAAPSESGGHLHHAIFAQTIADEPMRILDVFRARTTKLANEILTCKVGDNGAHPWSPLLQFVEIDDTRHGPQAFGDFAFLIKRARVEPARHASFRISGRCACGARPAEAERSPRNAPGCVGQLRSRAFSANTLKISEGLQ